MCIITNICFMRATSVYIHCMCLTFNMISTQSSHSSVLLHLFLTPEEDCVGGRSEVCVCGRVGVRCVCVGGQE